ncbi:MAG TPA: CPBP family intramembrane glutamic endopeptidase [Actinomycetota bacterium]|nr:CPBP family intramembrane glutamic endopeptidase [Actinomycetota bacterium]
MDPPEPRPDRPEALPPRPDLPTMPGAGGTPVAGPPGPAAPRTRTAAGAVSWRWWEALAAYLVALLLAGAVSLPVLQAVEPRGTAELVASVVADAVVVGLLLLWLRRFHPGWADAVGRPGRPLREAGAGFIGGLVLYPAVALGLAPLVALAIEGLTGARPSPPAQLPEELTGLGVAAAILFGLVAAPVQEELVFRGLLYPALRGRFGRWPAAWGQALLFGAVHYVPAPRLADSLLLQAAMVGTGLGLALIYERRGNLLAPIAAHAAFNLVGLAFVLGPG